jgi:ankyrin repeat protein
MLKSRHLVWLITGLIPVACLMLVLLVPEGGNAPSSELQEAICAGDIETVSALLNRGVDLNARLEYGPASLVMQHEMTPLLWAADCGHADIVKLLLERGADPNARDYYGATALFHAGRNKQMADLLLAASG